MSFQVGSACYDTALQAAQAEASSQVGAVVEHGSAAYVVDVSGVSGTSITYSLYPVAGGVAVTSAVPYSAQPCNLLTGSDGLAMSWAVVGVWIAVYAVMFIARALRGDTGGDYGNA